MTKPTVIDFFCGAGGFSEGFRQQGFEIIGGFDNWKPATDTFNHNFNLDSKVKDILEFKDSINEIESLPNTDVIVGSPPCVTFSSSNNSGKANKESGLLLTRIFLKIVAIKKYKKDSILKAWYMENVTNAQKHLKDCYTFEDLELRDWAEANGFSPTEIAITLKDNQLIVNSADYGSPQLRKRVIFGEILLNNEFNLPNKTHSDKTDDGLENWKTLAYIQKKLPKPNVKMSNRVISDPLYPEIRLRLNHLTDHFYDTGLYEWQWKQARYLKINHPYMGKMSFPEDEHKPSRTITATKSGSARESLLFKSEYNRKGNGEYRTPTIREAACLMGFPITYQFLGPINSKWRLVGNAVCPSVSKAFAKQLRRILGLDEIKKCIVIKTPGLTGVENLNTFTEKNFNNQPQRVKNSRFRRHPIKLGNLTVTLSNYDIENNSKVNGKWFTSIQYGTGKGFPIQKIPDNYFLEIESTIKSLEKGDEFVDIINNGFTERIGSASDLQRMYEKQEAIDNFLEPTELIEKLANILNDLKIEKERFTQEQIKIFDVKHEIPVKQVMALYAINKISSKANKSL